MIVDWLKQVGLEQHAAAFEANGLDIDVLPDLKEADLEHLGLSLGDRKRALRAIAAMGDKTPRAPLGTLGSTHPAVHEPHALRRQLSVMFCDVVGSTSLSAKLDPEDYELAIRTIQDACKTEILPRGGIIGQYHGDGVMAYFGYPQAHEDDAERAVRAGLAIVARIEEMRLASGDKPLVRLAVATGIVVIGEGAGSGPGHQQVFGETPNLAARLQNLAEPNALIIAGSTRRLLGELFVCKDLGLRDITGLPTPVSVWQVVAERKVETRFEARRVNHLTSFVGRTAELQKLSELWGLARSGSGQIALLCGEAGIGKSRVTSAFSQTIADQPHRVIRYQCSPHHTNSPFYPVIAQIERAAGLEAGDPANVKLDKLEALMRPDVAALSDMPLFAALLSIPFGSRYPDLHLTPQRQKDRTITAILSFLRGVSQAAPTLVLFEDIHWIDPSTLELVNRCIEAMHGMSCMLLATFRPEFYPLWLDQPHVTMLTLNRLRRDDTAAMLAHITRGKALPRDVYDQILSKTDGIPLFVEELTRAVIETGLLQEDNDRFVPLMPLQALTIPMTLQDSLMARLDRLAPVREIAQIGAALGREFSYRLIAAVAELPDMRLKEALAQLTAAELIFGRGAPPDSTYIFKHALVQDAAYESLLRSTRQTLHARIASVLEASFPDVTETQPEVLARHLAQSGQIEPGIDCMIRAGRRAIERSANAEAIGQLRQALELLKGLSEGPARAARALTLEVTLAQAMMAAQGYAAPARKEVLLQARTHINEQTDPKQKFSVLYGIWASYYVGSDVTMQRESASEFLYEAERHGDPGILCVAHRLLGTTLAAMGEFDIAKMHLENARQLYDPANHARLRYEFGQDVGVTALCYLTWVLWHLGHLGPAREAAAQAIREARASEHPFTLAYAICHVQGMLDVFQHSPHETRGYASEVISICDELGFSFWSAGGRILDGWAAVSQGQEEAGVETLRAGIVSWRKTGARLWLSLFLALEANIHSEGNRGTAALQTIDEALAVASETGEIWAVPEVLRIKAAIVGRTGDEAASESLLRQALAAAKAKNSRWWELCIACDLAELWHRQGQSKAAADLLRPIASRFGDSAQALDLRRAAAILHQIGHDPYDVSDTMEVSKHG